MSRQGSQAVLASLCSVHRVARPGVWRAATAEREIVSNHPVEGFVCGRLGRVVMNWSLERDGFYPSAVQDFDADILTSRQEWITLVEEGSERYAQRHERLMKGVRDPVTLLGLERQQLAYNHLLAYGEFDAPPLVSGTDHNHAVFRSIGRAITEALNGTATNRLGVWPQKVMLKG